MVSAAAANYRICVQLQKRFPVFSLFAIFAMPLMVVSGFLFRESAVLLAGSFTVVGVALVFGVAAAVSSSDKPTSITPIWRALSLSYPLAPILALMLAFPVSSAARAAYLAKEWEELRASAAQALETGSSDWDGGFSRKSGSSIFYEWSRMNSPRRVVRFCYSPTVPSDAIARLDGSWRVSPLRVGTSFPTHWYMLEGMPAWEK